MTAVIDSLCTFFRLTRLHKVLSLAVSTRNKNTCCVLGGWPARGWATHPAQASKRKCPVFLQRYQRLAHASKERKALPEAAATVSARKPKKGGATRGWHTRCSGAQLGGGSLDTVNDVPFHLSCDWGAFSLLPRCARGCSTDTSPLRQTPCPGP